MTAFRPVFNHLVYHSHHSVDFLDGRHLSTSARIALAKLRADDVDTAAPVGPPSTAPHSMSSKACNAGVGGEVGSDVAEEENGEGEDVGPLGGGGSGANDPLKGVRLLLRRRKLGSWNGGVAFEIISNPEDEGLVVRKTRGVSFEAEETFVGSRAGYVFKLGENGLGYYREG